MAGKSLRNKELRVRYFGIKGLAVGGFRVELRWVRRCATPLKLAELKGPPARSLRSKYVSGRGGAASGSRQFGHNGGDAVLGFSGGQPKDTMPINQLVSDIPIVGKTGH